MAVEILHLSSVVKSALVDRDGDRLGRVEDLIARCGVAPHPPITGVVAKDGAPRAVRSHRPHRRPAPRSGAVRGRHRQPAALRAAAGRAPAVEATSEPGT